MNKKHILIIEDEKSIVDFLKIGLEIEGYFVYYSYNGNKALKIFTEKKIDIVILDLMLPDIDGFKLCKILKEFNSEIPVIMLTAKKEIKDKISGFDAGADDYITKPFNFEELLARIKANLRKYKKFYEKIVKFKHFELNLETFEFRINNKIIFLTPKEFELMKLFMKNPNKVFTRENLIIKLYGYEYNGNDNVIDVHISHLRDKIGDKEHKIIKTHYGTGYSFKL